MSFERGFEARRPARTGLHRPVEVGRVHPDRAITVLQLRAQAQEMLKALVVGAQPPVPTPHFSVCPQGVLLRELRREAHRRGHPEVFGQPGVGGGEELEKLGGLSDRCGEVQLRP